MQLLRAMVMRTDTRENIDHNSHRYRILCIYLCNHSHIHVHMFTDIFAISGFFVIISHFKGSEKAATLEVE